MSFDATFWVAVSFFIFIGALVYFKIPQNVNSLLGKMILDIKNEIDESEKLRTESKKLLDNAQSKLNSVSVETKKILDEAKDWIAGKQKVILATVIQTWGSSPRQVGSRMIVNDKGDFSGSVSGGCVESAVVRECLNLLKEKKYFKKIEFKISNQSAWDVGLACGGEIAIFLEQIN